MAKDVSLKSRLAGSAYVTLARLLSPLPNFRGKVRFGLACYQHLHLRGQHIQRHFTLYRPVRHRMQLDMHCRHERMGLLMGGYEVHATEFSGRGSPVVAMSSTLAPYYRADLHSASVVASPTGNCRLSDLLRRGSAQQLRGARVQHRLNQLQQNLTLLECCLGADEGWVDVEVEGNLRAGEGTGTANVMSSKLTYEIHRTRMQLTTIDLLVSNGRLPKDCTLIKIDCDGYDFNVLRGRRLLATHYRLSMANSWPASWLGTIRPMPT